MAAVGLRGKSLERAIWGIESLFWVGVGVAGRDGIGLRRVREPSGFGAILRNSYGSMEGVGGWVGGTVE